MKKPQQCKEKVRVHEKIHFFFLTYGTVIFFILLIHTVMLFATEEKSWII